MTLQYGPPRVWIDTASVCVSTRELLYSTYSVMETINWSKEKEKKMQ